MDVRSPVKNDQSEVLPVLKISDSPNS